MTCWVTRMRSVIHGNALRASPARVASKSGLPSLQRDPPQPALSGTLVSAPTFACLIHSGLMSLNVAGPWQDMASANGELSALMVVASHPGARQPQTARKCGAAQYRWSCATAPRPWPCRAARLPCWPARDGRPWTWPPCTFWRRPAPCRGCVRDGRRRMARAAGRATLRRLRQCGARPDLGAAPRPTSQRRRRSSARRATGPCSCPATGCRGRHRARGSIRR